MDKWNYIKRNEVLTLAIILIFIIGTYFSFMWYVVTKIKEDGALSELGSFGDSFGVINSLFSGLGFAGLLITLVFQQRQIRNQKNEFLQQHMKGEILQYEETLHKLITLYQKTMQEVKIAYEGENITGRDAIQKSLNVLMNKMKEENIEKIPLVIQQIYKNEKANSDEIELIDWFYYKHIICIQQHLRRQWRLTETLKLMLRHLEKFKPEGIDNEQYRDLVFSQLTYIEYTYFFLTALAGKDNVELRELLSTSGMLRKFNHSNIPQLHRMMYKDLWGIDVNNTEEKVEHPIGKKRIKELKQNEVKIKKLISDIGQMKHRDYLKSRNKNQDGNIK
jgi:hypothetical protein